MRRAERTGTRVRGLAAALVLLCKLMGAVPARAQAEPVALQWNAPPDCSSARDVLVRVRKLTKSAQFPNRQLRAEATIAPRDHGKLHLKLILRAGDLVGERSIDGRTCEDLAGATAVVLALLLSSTDPLSGRDLDDPQLPTSTAPSPDVSLSAVETRADDSAQRSGKADPAIETTRVRSDDARARRSWYGLLQVPLVSLGIGPLPRPSVGFSLGAGARFEPWSFLAEGTFWLAQPLQSPDQTDSKANLRHIEAAVRSCRAFSFGLFELAPCARVAVQNLQARGAGAHVAPRTAAATWLAVGLGVQARYHIVQWFSFFGGVDGHVHTARPRISIDGVGNLGQLRPAALTISVGAQWIL